MSFFQRSLPFWLLFFVTTALGGGTPAPEAAPEPRAAVVPPTIAAGAPTPPKAIAPAAEGSAAPAMPKPSVPTPDTVKAVIGPLGPLPVPDDNPMTQAKVDLGKRLFEETRLSGDGSMACHTCHLPDHGYAVPTALGPAYPSQQERRNSPSLVNVGYTLPLLWDGRAGSLDKQALGPLGNILHMNGNPDLAAEQLKNDETYRKAFKRVFGDEAITPERIGAAIATFERTLVFDNSPFDRYMTGQRDALDEAQKAGLALFLGKANCMACHRGPTLTDNQFHNLGVPDQDVTGNPAALASIRFDAQRMGLKDWAELKDDPGRELATKEAGDHGKFRTMGLRNIDQSPPYMHNGALPTLEEVVVFYNRGGGEAPNKSRQMQPLGLSEEEQQQLVAFLHALTGRQRALNLPKE
jgi:cytochrome c peroxidase